MKNPIDVPTTPLQVDAETMALAKDLLEAILQVTAAGATGADSQTYPTMVYDGSKYKPLALVTAEDQQAYRQLSVAIASVAKDWGGGGEPPDLDELWEAINSKAPLDSPSFTGVVKALSLIVGDTDILAELNKKVDRNNPLFEGNVTADDFIIEGTGSVKDALADTASKSYVDSELNKKANLTYVNTQLAGKADTNHTHTFASITAKPTTVGGYGITDAYIYPHGAPPAPPIGRAVVFIREGEIEPDILEHCMMWPSGEVMVVAQSGEGENV